VGNLNIIGYLTSNQPMDPSAVGFLITTVAMLHSGGVAVLTVKAIDGWNSIATSYTGLIAFTGGGAGATLPANSTLASGLGVFSATLTTVASTSLTATDTVTASIVGSTGIRVVA
jgi:hypothetical protein